MNRDSFHELVRANIASHGHHITLVQGGPLPRFAYTIGLTGRADVELVFAGGAFFTNREVHRVLNALASQVSARDQNSVHPGFQLEPFGHFTLRSVDKSWARHLLLGVVDLLGEDRLHAAQIVPEPAYRTVDIPDLSQRWSGIAPPAWRWLYEPWVYPVPARASATTNLAALRGERVTEVVRWSETEWEMFAGYGPDVNEADVRVVPLATLVGVDESLEPAMRLEVGHGLWRDPVDLEWQAWVGSDQQEP